jgi:hypothetical protein
MSALDAMLLQLAADNVTNDLTRFLWEWDQILGQSDQPLSQLRQLALHSASALQTHN